MRKNSYIRGLTESQTLGYVLRSISEGKNEEQIAERFDGDAILVRTWIDALKQIHHVTTNQFNELVITSDGKNYLQKFDSDGKLNSIDNQPYRLNVECLASIIQ